MMRSFVRMCLLAGAAGVAVGCSRSPPPQPQLSQEQVSELMKQGKNQAAKERAGRGPGQGPGKYVR